MTKVVVIGGSGFVGQHLIRELHRNKVTATVVNRGRVPVPDTCQVIADRAIPSEMQAAAQLVGRVDVVIDTSSYSEDHTKLAWETFAPFTDRWIHLSSAAVYLPTEPNAPCEDDAIGGAPIWADYGRDKSAADLFLLEQAVSEPAFIVRPPYLYGPANDNDRETFIWSRLLAECPVIVPGTGQTLIQFLHVEDLARLLVVLALGPRRHHSVYNAAGGEAVSFEQWVQMCASTANRPVEVWTVRDAAKDISARAYFPFRDSPCVVNCDRLEGLKDWRPLYSLEEGLLQTYSHYQTSLPLHSVAEMKLITELRRLRGL